MIIRLLIAQRHCHHPGEFAPEAVAAVSENIVEDDLGEDRLADLFDEELRRAGGGDFVRSAVLRVWVDQDEVDRALAPVSGEVAGTVLKEDA